MTITLSKHEYMWFGDGGRLLNNSAIGYRIGGMPAGQEAYINHYGSSCLDDWQILRIENNVSSGWQGAYQSADDAFAALVADVNRLMI